MKGGWGGLPSQLALGERKRSSPRQVTHTPGASLEYPISLMCVFLLGGKPEKAEGEHANNVELEWIQEPSCFKGLFPTSVAPLLPFLPFSDAAESLNHLGGQKVVPIARPRERKIEKGVSSRMDSSPRGPGGRETHGTDKTR